MQLSITEQKSLFNTSPVLALLKQSLISCPATQVDQGRKGQQELSTFFQDFQRNKMQEIFFILFQKNP